MLLSDRVLSVMASCNFGKKEQENTTAVSVSLFVTRRKHVCAKIEIPFLTLSNGSALSKNVKKNTLDFLKND